MKLFCSSKLLKKLRRKCEKVPTPEDLLDRWYVNLIDLHGYNLLATILPDFRFCALVWNVPVDPSTDLTQLLVPAIREALHDPYYGIPQSVIDAYMPQDTVLELCTTGDSALINGMGAATKDVQYCSEYWYTYGDKLNTLEAQRKVNRDHSVGERSNGLIFTRWQAVKDLLQQRYGRGVPAMELEVSLDLQQYAAKRTLIVSEDITFDILNDYLKAAYHWEDEDTHQFILPPAGNRNAPLHIFGPWVNKDVNLKKLLHLWGEDTHLSQQLQAGDCFRYVYTAYDTKGQWEMDIRVRRRIPSAEASLPICTFCQGREPPDCVGSADDFQAFLQALNDPKNPKHQDCFIQAGLDWIIPDNAEKITRRLHLIDYYR